MMELKLTSEVETFMTLLSNGVAGFCKTQASRIDLPITRIDLKFDLTSEELPRVWAYLDTDPRGNPDSGTSKTYQVMERVCEQWAPSCHAANDGESVTVISPSGSTEVDDEESLCQAVGCFFVDIVRRLRDEGTFKSLPRAAKCYLGVSTYDGVFGWPAWKDRGPDNMA